ELIIKAQQKNVEYARSVAHVVIKNTGNYETLAEQLEECVLRLYAHDIFPEYYERIGQINRSFIHSFIDEHGLGGKQPEETAAILSQWYAGRYAGENPADNHVVKELLEITYSLLGREEASIIKNAVAELEASYPAAARKMLDDLSACGTSAILSFFTLNEAGARNLGILEFERNGAAHINVAVKENDATIRSFEVDQRYSRAIPEIFPVIRTDSLKEQGCSFYEYKDEKILRWLIGFVLCHAGVALYEAHDKLADPAAREKAALLSRKYLQRAMALAPSFTAHNINLSTAGGRLTADDFLRGQSRKWQSTDPLEFSLEKPWVFITKCRRVATALDDTKDIYAHDGSAISQDHIATFKNVRSGLLLDVQDNNVEFAIPMPEKTSSVPDKDRDMLIRLKRMYGVLSSDSIQELLIRSEPLQYNQITIRNDKGIKIAGGFVILSPGDSYDTMATELDRYDRAGAFRELANRKLPLVIIPEGSHDEADIKHYADITRQYLDKHGIIYTMKNDSVFLLNGCDTPEGDSMESRQLKEATANDISAINRCVAQLLTKMQVAAASGENRKAEKRVDLVIDTSLIDRRDLDENVESIARLIVLLRDFRNVHYIFKNCSDLADGKELPHTLQKEFANAPAGKDFAGRLREAVKKYGSGLLSQANLDALIARVGYDTPPPAVPGESPIEIPILAMEYLEWLRDANIVLRDNQFPVAMKGLTCADAPSVLMRDFESAFFVGIAKSVLIATDGNPAEPKKNMLKMLNALYKKIRGDPLLSMNTLEYLINTDPTHRLNRAIELYIPAIGRMAIDRLKALHEHEQRLLEFA
ncbi:MAG: hypothetical protein PHT32_04140, partial [Candidatus Omnitrophica bacterium]|nr:hypothetical protein [Candidatus Omnitrophota bacterium]